MDMDGSTKPVSSKGKFSFDDEIVISGISGRFPDSDDLEEFRNNLYNRIDMVTEDDRRWPPGTLGLPRRMGKLKNLEKFDADFFGVSVKQCERMDPQMRILLELAHEAVFDAGVNCCSLGGSDTGVFIGGDNCERLHTWLRDPTQITGYEGTGCTRSMLSNRISFTMDLNGPSVSIDTACSSSLSALDLALNAIKMGRCGRAIVGAVYTLLTPNFALKFHPKATLARDGVCRSFDADGRGYVKSEAAVVIYLEQKPFAHRSYATVLNARTNSDGYKVKGIASPSGEMQERLLQDTYNEAGICPLRVAYVEAHGTGTPAGDPQELKALAQFFCKGRRTNPLLIGSVKSNMGHSEPAAGLCGIAKLILAMQEGVIPGNLHFNKPNPKIPHLFGGNIKIVSENTACQDDWLYAVCSYGNGGTNGHAIFKPSGRKMVTSNGESSYPIPILIPFSGRTEQCVLSALKQITSSTSQPQHSSAHLVGLLHHIYRVGIPRHGFRGFGLVYPKSEGENENPAMIQIHHSNEQTNKNNKGSTRPPSIAFIFTGMGCQWSGMGRHLFENFSVFRKSVKMSAKILQSHGIDLLHLMFEGGDALFENILNPYVAITAVQIGLVDLLRSINITADVMVGHSFGEFGCAYVDGCLSAEETIKMSLARGRACVGSVLPGTMAVVGLSVEELKGKECPSNIYVACHNAVDNIVLSGPMVEMREFLDSLRQEKIFTKQVNCCNSAYHSPYIYHIEPALTRLFSKVIGQEGHEKLRSTRWISSSIPTGKETMRQGEVLGAKCSVAYHVNNFLSPVLFQEAVAEIPKENPIIAIEIAPSGLLQSILERSFPKKSFKLMQKDCGDNTKVFLTNIGKLYNQGLNPWMENLYQKIEFPVSLETPMLSPLVKWDYERSWSVPKWETDLAVGAAGGGGVHNENVMMVVEICLDREEDQFYSGHVIAGQTLFPPTGYLMLVWKAFAKLKGTTFDRLPVIFEQVKFLPGATATILTTTRQPVQFQIGILKGSGKFEIMRGDLVMVTGQVRLGEEEKEAGGAGVGNDFCTNPPSVSDQGLGSLNTHDVYKELGNRGYHYDGVFRSTHSLDVNGTRSVVRWNGNWPAFLDAIFHLKVFNLTERSVYLPTKIDKFHVDPVAVGKVITNATKRGTTIDFSVSLDPHMNALRCTGVEVLGVELAPISQNDQNVSGLDLDNAQVEVDRHTFTNYFDKNNSETIFTNAMMSQENTLRFLLHIAMENSWAELAEMCQLYSSSGGKDGGSGGDFENLMKNILHFLPQTRNNNYWGQKIEVPTFNVCLPNRENKEPVIDPVAIEWVEKCHLVITNDEGIIGQIGRVIKCGNFVLYHDSNPLHHHCNNGHENFLLVAQKVFGDGGGTLKLLRKKDENPADDQDFEIFEVDTNKNNYLWIDDLKTVLQSDPSGAGNSKKLYILSKNESTSSIVEMINCLKLVPGGHRIRGYFSRDDLNFRNPQLKLQIMADLVINAHQNGEWGTYCHFPCQVGGRSASSMTLCKVKHACLIVLKLGDLESLNWIESNCHRIPDRQKIVKEDGSCEKQLIHVHYAGLNLKDILQASGKLSPGPDADHELDDAVEQNGGIGQEYSGIDAQGQRVFGLVKSGAFATTLMAEKFCLKVPLSWTLAEAATVSMAYATAYFGLIFRAKLCPQESILIHSGSSAVGLAAISVALSMNCQIFTTVGSNYKRLIVKRMHTSLKHENIFSSRTPNFQQSIMRLTGGRGVDVVLNCLGGDNKLLQASLRCLAPKGRFVQMRESADSVEEEDTPIPSSILGRDATFSAFTMQNFVVDPNAKEYESLRQLLEKKIQDGVVKPLPTSIFGHGEAKRAFKFMASGKHEGKVLIQIRHQEPSHDDRSGDHHGVVHSVKAILSNHFLRDKVYVLVAGRNEDFGLELAEWLIDHGARKLVLVSRSSDLRPTTAYQELRLRKWRQKGCDVATPAADVSTVDGATQFLQETNGSTMMMIGGIFIVALAPPAAQDSLNENDKSTADLELVAGRPKIDVTASMDTASRLLKGPLDHFVVFTSVVGGRHGNFESNYGYTKILACKSICEQRRKAGLSGLAIEFRIVGGEAGHVALDEKLQNAVNYSMLGSPLSLPLPPQSIRPCLDSMDTILLQNEEALTFSLLLTSPESKSRLAEEVTKVGRLNLVEETARIVGMDKISAAHYPMALHEIGADSLMTIQIKHLLEVEFNTSMSLHEIQQLTFLQLEQISSSKRGGSLLVPQNHGAKVVQGTTMGDENIVTKRRGSKKVFEKQMREPIRIDSVQQQQQPIVMKPAVPQNGVNRWWSYHACYVFVVLYLFLLFVGAILCLPIYVMTKLVMKCFYSNEEMKLVSEPWDSLFASLLESPNILVTFTCQGIPDRLKFMELFSERVLNKKSDNLFEDQHGPYDRLRWRLTHNYLYSVWRRQRNFRLSDHYVFETIFEDSSSLQEEIEKQTEFYVHHQFPSDKPRWLIHVIESPREGRFAFIFAFNHAYGDGFSLRGLIKKCFYDGGEDTIATTTTGAQQNEPEVSKNLAGAFTKPSSWYRGVKAGLMSSANSLAAVVNLVPHLAHVLCDTDLSKFGQKFGRTQICTRYGSVVFDRLALLNNFKQQQCENQVTIYTILIATTVKVFQRIYQDEGQKLPLQLSVMSNQSEYRSFGLSLQNSFAGVLLNVPTNIEDPVSRINTVATLWRHHTHQSLINGPRQLYAFQSVLPKPVQTLVTWLTPKLCLGFTAIPFDLEENVTMFGGFFVKKQQFAGNPPFSHSFLGAGIGDDCLDMTLTVPQNLVKECPLLLDQFFVFLQQEFDELMSRTGHLIK